MNYKNSRGWRNNNPLNIRRGDRWQGLRALQNDKEFCQFVSMSFGYRAAVKVLMSYFRYFLQQGIPFTYENIIRRWAPSTENNTEAYIRRVLDIVGEPHAEVKIGNPYTELGRRRLAWLIVAMTCVECGCNPEDVDYTSINTGFRLAGLGEPSLKEKGPILSFP